MLQKVYEREQTIIINIFVLYKKPTQNIWINISRIKKYKYKTLSNININNIQLLYLIFYLPVSQVIFIKNSTIYLHYKIHHQLNNKCDYKSNCINSHCFYFYFKKQWFLRKISAILALIYTILNLSYSKSYKCLEYHKCNIDFYILKLKNFHYIISTILLASVHWSLRKNLFQKILSKHYEVRYQLGYRCGDPIWIVDDNGGRWYGRYSREKREISEMKKNAR